MEKKEIIEKLNSVKSVSSYVRVSDNHPIELYLGLNDKGFPTLRFNGQFTPIKLSGNSLLEIKQIKFEKFKSILFSYNSKENLDLFYIFCHDLICNTEKSSNTNAYTILVNRYNQWKKLFYSSSSILSEDEIKGLIGELTFLKEQLINTSNESFTILGWSGPDPTHKDFSYNDDWYEIKTISSSSETVHISSLEQLDSNHEGRLVVYKLEKMSPTFNGVTLNKLVKETLDLIKLETNSEIFISKLSKAKYVYNENYDNFVYNLVEKTIYKVSDGFPRIKKQNIPIGIAKAKYEINLDSIKPFKE